MSAALAQFELDVHDLIFCAVHAYSNIIRGRVPLEQAVTAYHDLSSLNAIERGFSPETPRKPLSTHVLKAFARIYAIQNLTTDTFETEVIDSTLPVLIDSGAPMSLLSGGDEALSVTYAGKVKVTKVEAPKNRRLCVQLKVMSPSTDLLYKDVKEVERLSVERKS